MGYNNLSSLKTLNQLSYVKPVLLTGFKAKKLLPG